MIWDFFSLALKNLRHRGIRSWLTLLGIFIGVAAVVSLISLGGALKMTVSSQFGVSQTDVITIQAGGMANYGPPGSNTVKPLTLDDVEAVKSLGSAYIVIPRSLEAGKLEYNDKVVFGYATDVPNGKNRDFMYEFNDLNAEQGRLLEESDVNRVVLGYNFLADKVGLDKPVISGKKVLINDKQFEVVGVMQKKGSFIWDNIVLMNYNELKNLFNVSDEVDLIAIHIEGRDMNKSKQDIEKVLRKSRNVKIGEEDFSVSTPEASLATVNSVLGGVQMFIVIIASISIFIGSVGIINTMTTSVLERKKEIGIMKAIGAKNEHIFMQFFIEAGLLGLIGGLAGVLIGTLIGVIGTSAINNFLGADISPNINFVLIFFTLLGSFLIGAVAGIIPAMNAAKQNPVEALRE